jgi:hypothetical protein
MVHPFDGSEVHVVKYHDELDGNQEKKQGNLKRDLEIMSLRHPGKPGGGTEEKP